MVPENIYAPPMEGYWKNSFLRGSKVVSKAKMFEAKLEFPQGGIQTEKLSMGSGGV